MGNWGVENREALRASGAIHAAPPAVASASPPSSGCADARLYSDGPIAEDLHRAQAAVGPESDATSGEGNYVSSSSRVSHART